MFKTAHRTIMAVLLLPALLAGCDAIYDDTKGWAKRLETSLLRAAHGEPQPGVAAPGVAAPVEAIPSGEMAPPPAVPAEPATDVAVAAPTTQATPPEALEGAMAAASEALLANDQAAPPLPEAKPQQTAEAPSSAKQAEADDASLVAVMLHLSSLRSEEAAKRQWHDLQESFPNPLGPLQAQFHRADLGEQGTFYRVLAGPLPSRDATAVCAALKAKSAEQYCRILPQKPEEKPKA